MVVCRRLIEQLQHNHWRRKLVTIQHKPTYEIDRNTCSSAIMGRIRGIEPLSSAWKAVIIPLYYIRVRQIKADSNRYPRGHLEASPSAVNDRHHSCLIYKI